MAEVDGRSFRSAFAFARPCALCAATGHPDGIEIAALAADESGIALAIQDFDGPGSYTFDTEGQVGGAVYDDADGDSYATDWPGGSGSVTVTASSEASIQGTFRFVARDGPGGPRVEVTGGRFNVPFQQVP